MLFSIFNAMFCYRVAYLKGTKSSNSQEEDSIMNCSAMFKILTVRRVTNIDKNPIFGTKGAENFEEWPSFGQK